MHTMHGTRILARLCGPAWIMSNGSMTPSRAPFLDPEELDPEDDEDMLDPHDEYDSYNTQEDYPEDWRDE
jgi:hypothetical protein